MKLYRLLTGDYSTEFCHKFFDALSKSWDHYGNPTYAHDQTAGVVRCGQAVFREVGGGYSLDLKLGLQ